jgi:hypothetical protein
VIATTNAFQATTSNQKFISDKFIAFECDIHSKYGKYNCGGWGDRLKGIMVAYGWSLITNRNLLINIARPCLLTSLLLPNEVNWSQPMPQEPPNYTNISNLT